MIRRIVGSSLMVLAASAAFAQTAEPQLSFDAASLKPAEHPNTGNQIRRMLQGGPGSPNPGQYNFANVTLKILVQQAYDLKEYQVEGPDWIDNAEYDLVAKIPKGSTQEQTARMMQTLLAERFHLVFHRDKKQMPVYALTVSKGGSKLKEVAVPTAPSEAPPPMGGRGGSGGPGVRVMMTNEGVRMAGYMTMRQLTDLLTRRLARPVLDETELKATYDVDLNYMPDGLGGRGGPGGDSAGAAPEPGLSLEQALTEKLGLKLETRKSEAEILIVDRAEKVPVEN